MSPELLARRGWVVLMAAGAMLLPAAAWRGEAAPSPETPATQPVPAAGARKPATTPATRPKTPLDWKKERERRLKRLEELRRRARESAARRKVPASQPKTQPARVEPQRPQPSRAAPPTRPSPARPPTGTKVAPPPPPADGRTEWFNFVNMPWEEVVKHFAERIGKPLMPSDVVIGGELTYQTTRRFTKQEAIDELNFLLVEQGFFMVETENYVYVVPLSELPKLLPLKYFFDSYQAFEKANLRDMEFASVRFPITDRPAQEIVDMLAPSMPDRALPVVIDDTNVIRLTGLAKDIRRFKQLLDMAVTRKLDPRKVRIFDISTNAREIERMVRELLGAGQPQRKYNPQTRRVETVYPQSKVKILADERTNTLIVKGTPEELEEVEQFIKTLDKKPDLGEFKTHVIEIQHGNATEIANLLNQIFQQEQGQTTRRFPSRFTRTTRGRTTRTQTTRTNAPAPQDIIVEDIYERAKKAVRLVADERTNSLIVYANEDGLKRVKEMLEVIDKPVPSNFRTFKLRHARAEQIRPIVEQIARGVASQVRGRTARAGGPTVVVDPASNALHVVADREAMDRIAQIIADLDTPAAELQQHVIQLSNLTPSRAAQMVQALLSGTPAPARSRFGRRGGRTAPTAQVIPLDEANLLIVYCPDEKWEKIEATIKLWDENAVSSEPELKFFKIENGDAQQIAETLMQLYRGYTHPVLGRRPPFVTAQGNEVVVQAVRPAMEEIEALIPVLDRKVESTPLVIIPLANADATQVAQVAAGLLPQTRGRRGAGARYAVHAEPVTNSLIVRADKLSVERIKEFARQMDEQVAAVKPERRYYTLRNASPRDVVQAIQQLFGATVGGRRGRGPVGTQVKTVIVGNQVVVDAPAGKQAEIATLIEQLDALSDRGITTLLVKMPGADVRSIAARLSNAFRDRVRQQGVIARFEADASTESILVTVSKEVQDEAEKLLEEYRTISEGLVNQTEFYQLQHANANDVAGWLRNELVTMMSKKFGRQAAQQVRVTADTRTNRVIISAPQVAVKAAIPLLEQYDVPQKELSNVSPMVTETRKLPGLDVANLANQLNRAFQERNRQRADRLRTTFGYDRLTEMLIITTPKDTLKEIDELIAKFVAETEGMQAEQKFIEIKNADANYIAGQLRNILNVRISSRRGRDIASRVNIQVDPRLNRVIVNAPKFAVEMAEALVAELDKEPTTESQLHTIPLENADANTVLGILRTIFNEKIRARTLQISAEPLTNSLIVGGNKEDVADIEQWAKELDAKATEAVSEPVIIELKNANPWEVYNVLQTTFVQRGYGRRLPPSKQIKISIVAGRSLVVQAPPDKLKQIQELAAQLDAIGKDEMVMRSYKLPGLGTQLNQFARQIERAVNAQRDRREPPVSITALPAADTLIVTATEKKLPEVERAMEQFKDLYKPLKVETIALLNADANAVYQALARVLQPKIRAGKLQLGVEPMTNSLIVSASEQDMAEIREWAAKFDQSAAEAIVPPQIFELKNANPWEVRNILYTTFAQSGMARRRGGMEIRFDVVGGRSIVAKAPADKMKQIAELIAKLDEVGANKAEVRTYTLAGLGPRINDFARQLQTALDRQRTGREPRVSITAYPPAEALIVAARSDQFEQVEQMMDQLKPLMQVTKARTEFFELKYVDATQIVNTVRDLVQKRSMASGRRGSQNFSVSADPRTNRLIVFAPESILPEVREVVQALDVEVEDTSVVTIELKYADPWEVRNMINDVFGYRGSRRGQSQTEQVYVTVSNNTLIVKAPPKKLEQIRELIARIDAENTGGIQVKLYPLKVLNATQVAMQVQFFLRSQGRVTRRGQMQPGAFAEPTTNTLVVLAPADQIPFIDTLIEQIESMEPDQAVMQTYVLRHARAEAVQRSVDQMLRAKVAEREGQVRGRNVQQRTAVMADPDTNRLFVFAPPEYQKLAGDLIGMIDQEVESGQIVHIVRLERADAVQLARTINETLRGSAGRGRGAAPRVTVTADAGSNSILISGLPRDVAEVEKLVGDLEANSDTVPELQVFRLKYASAVDVSDALAQLFPSGRNPADNVTVTADEYENKLMVTASKRKMRQVEAFIEQLDAPPPAEGEGMALGDKDIYFVEVYRGDPFDISYDVAQFFPPPERGGPTIDSDMFGQYIKVICRPAEFPRIERLIRKFDRAARVEMAYRFIRPKAELARLVPLLKAEYPDLVIEQAQGAKVGRPTIVEELWGPDEVPPGAESQKPQQTIPAGVHPFLAPPELAAPAQQMQSEQPAPTTQPVRPQRARASGQPAATEPPIGREPVRITVLPDGRIAIRGPRPRVEELEDAIDLLQEDLGVGEVIRIFRFRYGDVNAAARILDIMFNARQVRMPQVRLPQQPQQRGRQPAGARGQQRGGQAGAAGGLLEQIRGMIGGRAAGGAGGAAGGTPPIRIATDTSHNYLIVKCDESQLPEIRQVLRELDIPPAKVDVKVFQLRNLDARETADNIKAVLGIGTRPGASRLPMGRTAGRNPQAQLMQILQQQMVSLSTTGVSAKIESVQIVPNSVTNSILVSAPPDVMKIIEDVLGMLEKLEGHDVTVIRHYVLKQAKVEDVLPLLQEVFAATAGGRGRGRANPADLGPVSISGDPRSNTLIYACYGKDVPVVEEQIRMLDIEGAVAEAELYTCQFGDAASIAQTVEAIFARTPARGGGRRGRGAAPASGSELRITAEPMTNTILVWGPADRRALVLEKIEQLDRLARSDIREIDVKYADAEKLADKLREMFGGAAPAAQRRGRRGRSAVAQTPGRLVILGDKNAGKLLVRASDAMFEQISSVVALLDHPSEQIQIRRYTLQYADAEVVVDAVKNALSEFIMAKRTLEGQRDGGDMGLDAFTAVADPRTNSVIVVGSEQTFHFVETVLASIDVETPAEQQRQFRVFVLREADAQTVADAINSFAASGGQTGAVPGRSRRPSRRGRGMGFAPTGAGLTQADQLDVYAVAEPLANAVMVFGKPEDIDRVAERVIDPLEKAIARQLATVPVHNVPPSQIASLIAPMIEQRGEQAGRTVQITPNDNGKTIVVWGTQADIDWVRELAAQYDTPDLMPDEVKIIPIPFGQDPAAIAAEVQRVVNEGEQIRSQATGRPPRQITIGTSENQLIVYGDPSMYGLVENVVQQITQGTGQVVTRVIELTNLSTQDAIQLIQDLQQQREQRSSTPGRSPSIRPSGSRTRITPRSGRSRSRITPSPRPPAPSRRPTPSRRTRPRRPAMRRPRGLSGGTPLIALFGDPVLPGRVLAQATRPAVAPAVMPQRPATRPATPGGLNVIAGQLRGNVFATPIDSRRLVITGDERDVEFILQMLALMEKSTPQAVVEVFRLEHAKAAAIAPVVESTMQALIENRGGGQQRTDRFSIIAEARSNSLIVSASETNMEMIAALIEQLDVETMRGTEFKAVALKHIRASEAAAILQPVIERLNRMREVPAEAQASIEVIERSNSLLIVGTPADIAEIEKMIEGIDFELPEEDDFSVARAMFIQLQNAKAEDLAEVLEDLIEAEKATGGGQGQGSSGRLIRRLLITTHEGKELPPLDLDKPIRIIAEKARNSLIIFSSPKNNEALKAIVGQLDSLPGGPDIDVKTFALKHADAKSVADMLQKLFDDARKNVLKRAADAEQQRESGVMPPVPPGLAGSGLPFPVVVTNDPRTNTVIVVGHKQSVLLAAGLVGELDKPGTDLNLKTFVIHLKNIQAARLQEKLKELLDERAKALGGDQVTARDNAVIVPDDRSNSLVVIGTPETYQMISDLAMQLDKAESYRVVATHLRKLKFADAAKLAGMLQELFDRKKDANQQTETQTKDVLFVLADARSNSLLLTGTRDYLTEAEKYVDQLDQAFDPTVEFKVRPVLLNSAVNIASLLTEMIDKTRGSQTEQMRGTPIQISADPYSNSLLLAASHEDMLMLQRWIDVLDKPAEPGRVTRIIPMKRGDAEQLAQRAQELFQTQQQGGSSDVTVTFDDTTNAVVAIGPPAVVKDIEDFLGKLDTTEATAGAVVKIFKLEEAEAQDAGELLRALLEGRSGSVTGRGGGTSAGAEQAARQVMLIYQKQHPELGVETLKALRSEIQVLDHPRTNSLMVTAPPESMPLVESLIAAIDVPPAAAQVRIFPLRNSDAEQMVQTLRDLFEQTQQQQAGGGTAGERELTLGEALGKVTFTTDTRTNSVIAAGTQGYLDLVEELVLELDSRPIENRKVLVYQPHYNSTAAIQQAVSDLNDREQQLLQQMQEDISPSQRMSRQILAVASEDTGRIVLDYDPRREPEVLELLRQLDQPPPQVMIQVLIVEVTMDNSLELGVEFAFQDLQFTRAGPQDTTSFDFVAGTDIGAAGSGLGGFTFTVTGRDFNFLFRTLQNEGNLNVLSRPQIVAMDNQEAEIEIVNDVPIVTQTSTSIAGQITSTVQREQVGIRLTVTPQINPDGFVRMEIEQEVSDVTGSNVDVGQGITQPVFFRRRTNTTVTVKDNETVVLGGLITTRTEQREQKVPILGDVPVLGLLFRNDRTTNQRTELLVILTPHVIRSVEDYRELSIHERDEVTRLPDEVVTSPLMQSLRVKPEELRPQTEEGALGPFPPARKGPGMPASQPSDVYGPPPPRTGGASSRLGQESYSIPIVGRVPLAGAGSTGKP